MNSHLSHHPQPSTCSPKCPNQSLNPSQPPSHGPRTVPPRSSAPPPHHRPHHPSRPNLKPNVQRRYPPWISLLRQRIVETSMTRARWRSHLRARRKRRRRASGWSDFTMDQNAEWSSSGVSSLRVCWNSLVWPYMSSSSPAPGAEWLDWASESSLWRFLLLKREWRFLPLDFFVGLVVSVSVFGSLLVGDIVAILGAAGVREGSLTPRVLRVRDQNSRSLSSCSGVRLPRWPGGTGISKYRWWRGSALAESSEVVWFAETFEVKEMEEVRSG